MSQIKNFGFFWGFCIVFFILGLYPQISSARRKHFSTLSDISLFCSDTIKLQISYGFDSFSIKNQPEGDKTCGPFVDNEYNHYQCLARGNCTWWAAYKRQNIGLVSWGNANSWLDEARLDGYGVCTKAKSPNTCLPLQGAIAWWNATPTWSAGHVAYVEGTQPFTVSEMNAYASSANYPPPPATPIVWLNQGQPIRSTPPDGYIFGFAADPVALFSNVGFEGDQFTFMVPTGLEGANLPIWLDKKVSSINIQEPQNNVLNWAIKIYEEQNLEGGCLLIDEDTLNLTDEYRFNNGHLVNDNISSIQVFEGECPPPCPGTNRALLNSGNGLGYGICSSPPNQNDKAQFIIDVTLPDGIPVFPNQATTKIWRVKNVGQTTWSGYKLIFSHNNPMGGSTVDIDETPPGAIVDIPLPIITPAQTSYSNWKIVNNQGTDVEGGELYIYLTIENSEPPPAPLGYSLVCTNCPAMVEPGTSFWPNFRATIGSGQLLESRGDMLRHKSGDRFGAHELVMVDGVVNPGTYAFFNFYEEHPITAPTEYGTYQTTWQLWQNDQWVGPEYTITFEVGDTQNDPPHAPTLTGPGDWAVYYGNTGINLSAQHNGDPDGDAVNEYYFEIFESAQNMNSGWITSNTWTPQGLAFNGYQWRVKVRDSHEAESSWSNLVWHFSVMNNDPEIYDFHSETCRESWGGAEKICFCAQTNAGTLRLQVNMASDGSDDGEWVVLNELGTSNYECSVDTDQPPNWAQLEGETGTHLVRLYARRDGGWENARLQDIFISLPANRRPNQPVFVEPPRESYVNFLTVHLDWEESLRTDNYQLVVADNSGFTNPIVNTTLPAGTTEYNLTLPSDYPTVYWRVTATGPHGSHANDTYFYTDITAPNSTIQTLPPMTTDTRFSVSWSGSDNRSGIRWYHVQVRDGNRPEAEWVDWLVNTSQTAELFDGQPGHTYYFRVRAMDLIGNWENWFVGDGDTSTLINLSSGAQTVWWDTNYALKRSIKIVNHDPHTMPTHFPVGIRFDNNTDPTAAELYNASLSSIKGDDVRVVYNNTTELSRIITKFTPSEIVIWFPLQANLGGADETSYQLYYGYTEAINPLANINEVFLPEADANTMMLAHFQEGSGSTVNDSSGRNHHGNFISPGWIDGYLGTAGLLNGSTSKIDFGNHSDFNVGAMTLEAWVFITAETGAYEHIFDKEKYWFRVSSSRQPQFNAFETRADGVCPNLNLNTWYHLAATYNGSNRARIYVNGEMCNEKIESHSPNHTSASFMVGAEHVPAPLFPGYIQHIRVSNIERTDFAYAKVDVLPSVAVGSAINQPSNQPLDLAILDLLAYPSSEGGVLIQAIVQNQSEANTANGFYADLYVDHLPIGIGDYTNSLNFWVNTSIEPNATVTLTTLITDFLGLGTVTRGPYLGGEETIGTLYAQVDTTGVISETDHTNNIYTSGLEVCVAASDNYEGDDSHLTATVISFNQAQTHNFHKLSDQDWFEITVQEGITYTLYTYNLDVATDTHLYLYAEDGTTLLASNDDSGNSLASNIVWTAPAAGTYYVAVKHWNPNVAGCKNSYTFKFKEFGNDIYLPTILNFFDPSSPTPTPTPQTITPTPTATPPTVTPTPTPSITPTPTPTPTPIASWQTITTINAPSPRQKHSAIWTGSEMIIWGGQGLSGTQNDGARYNPTTNTWTTLSTIGAPSARRSHTAVWTGSEMIIWGGIDSNGIYLDNGGRYNVNTDTWTLIPSNSALSARAYHPVIWTGSEMIIWGGQVYISGSGWVQLNDGARYNPSTNSWVSLQSVNAPDQRSQHSAIWTGTQMLIWGGKYSIPTSLNNGAIYNLVGNNWQSISTTNVPSARLAHTTIWTGSEMIIWGGLVNDDSFTTLGDGGRYQVSTDTWGSLSNINPPSSRTCHTAIWTGNQMLIWGGLSELGYLNTGASYNPINNVWSNLVAENYRACHTAVWTGSVMIVWGGSDETGLLNSGSKYLP